MGLTKYAPIFCLAALTTAIPQAASTDDIPTCAYPPLLSTLQGTGCSLSDINCVCGKQDLIPTITSAVVEACAADPTPVSSTDVMQFIKEFCGDAIPATNPTSTAAASTETASSSPSPSSSSSSSTATEAATTTTDLSLSSTTDVAVTAPTGYWLWVANGTCSCAAGNSTLNGTMPSWATSTPSASDVATGEAGKQKGVSVLAFVVAVVGMSWVFGEF